MTYEEIKNSLSTEDVYLAINKLCTRTNGCTMCPIYKECHDRCDYEMKAPNEGGMPDDENEMCVGAIIAGALAGIDLLKVHEFGNEDGKFNYRFEVEEETFECENILSNTWVLKDDKGFLLDFGTLYDCFKSALERAGTGRG